MSTKYVKVVLNNKNHNDKCQLGWQNGKILIQVYNNINCVLGRQHI